MTWLVHTVTTWLEAQMKVARDHFGVDPVVFIVLLLGMSPVFYYSIYRMVRAVAKRRASEITLWSTLFLFSTAAPYLYVLVAGRNLPWWVYILAALILGQGIYSLVRRLRKKPDNPKPEERA